MNSNDQKLSVEDKLLRIDKKTYWIIAGVLSALIVLLGLKFSGMIYGDEYVVQRGDLLESHMAYIKMICRHLLNGESIWYSFDISMGMNTSLLLAYYVFSPFNIIFLLLYRLDDNVAIIILLMLKTAFAASFFQIFSKRVLKIDNLFSIIFSICYSLCGFTVAYGFYHIMWLDGVIALPIICLLITLSIEEKKHVFLVLCYTYAFTSQFYIGYMVSVFSVLYLIVNLLYRYKNNLNIKELIKAVGTWLLSVLEAILLSAVVWLPALLFLLNSYSPDSTEFDSTTGVTILEIINSLFWGQYTDNFGKDSFSYSGIPVLLVAPFYFINKKISVKERILAGMLLLFFVVGYLFPPLYKLLHAFDAPDFFSFRFSFLLSFLLCAIATRQSKDWEDIGIKKLLGYSLILLFLFALNQRLEEIQMIKYSAHTTSIFLVNMCFIIAWCILFFWGKRTTKNIVAVSLSLIVLLGAEETSNICMFMDDVGKTTDLSFYSWDAVLKAGVNTIQENENGNFYRIIVDSDLTHNSDSYFGYNGICDFGSAENYNLRKSLSNFGFGTSPRITCASGFNPASEMLLGIKYHIFPNIPYKSNNKNDIIANISQNKNTLNIGFMVENEMVNYQFPSKNVFESLNDILSKMSGISKECFTEIPTEDISYNYIDANIKSVENGDTVDYRVLFDNLDGQIGFEVKNNNYDKVYLQFQGDMTALDGESPSAYANNIVSTLDHYITLGESIELNYYPESDLYYVVILDVAENTAPFTFRDINLYAYDEESLTVFYDDLSKEQLCIDEYKSGYVKGHITVNSERRILFTSIPFDKGWRIYANGEEIIPFSTVGNSFLAFELPDKGNYEIEMKYEAPGVRLGAFISLFGVISLVVLCLLKKQVKKTNNIFQKSKEMISVDSND